MRMLPSILSAGMFTGLWLLSVVQASEQKAISPAAHNRYHEVMLEPIPAGQYSTDESDCGCSGEGDSLDPVAPSGVFYRRPSTNPEPWAYVSVVGGASYNEFGTGSELGGQYGAYAFKPLTSGVALFGAASINHADSGHQFGGSLGLWKIGVDSPHVGDRIGWSLNYDQYTDTGLGSPYVGAFRYSMDYQLNPVLTAGARYSHSVTGGSVESVIPGAGNVGLTPFELVEGYVKSQALGADVQLGAGYNSDLNAGL